MSTTLHNCGRLEVRNSPIEGFGIFATENIKAGEVLEEVPFVLFPRYTALGASLYNSLNASGFLSDKEKNYEYIRKVYKFKEPEKYYFKWIPPVQPEGAVLDYMVLPLGYGPIYNTANANNNAGWKITEKTFIFTAEKDILKGEEIRTFYGYFLGEDGSIWNAEQVYHLGFDKNSENNVRLLSLRFQTPELVARARNNQTFARLQNFLNQNPLGLKLLSISTVFPDGSEKNKTDIQDDEGISKLYNKLVSYKRIEASNPSIAIRAEFGFLNERGEPKTEKFLLANP